jgi:transcriptional regulator with XRE-family HTH domain
MTRSSAEPINTSKAAARLRLTRQALKLSQAGLCRITCISPQAWNNAETGDNLIGIANAMNLCRTTGVTLDWIYRGVHSNLPKLIVEEIARRKRAAKRRRRFYVGLPLIAAARSEPRNPEPDLLARLCLAKWPRVHPHLHLKNCWANSPG